MSNFLFGCPQFARARIITNAGDVIEGRVGVMPAGNLMGVPMYEPPMWLPFDRIGDYQFSHCKLWKLTPEGVAVYLEEA